MRKYSLSYTLIHDLVVCMYVCIYMTYIVRIHTQRDSHVYLTKPHTQLCNTDVTPPAPRRGYNSPPI